MATMEPKVICVLLLVFSLALSSLAQVQTGKQPSSCFLGGVGGAHGHRKVALVGVFVSQCVVLSQALF